MQRRPSAARLLKAQEIFRAAAIAFLVERGARPGNFYDYVLDTPAGVLNISPYGNWIACRFDDVARGRAFTSACGYSSNPFSGKWNHHPFNGSVESLDPATALADFRYYLDKLLAWKPVLCPADVL